MCVLIITHYKNYNFLFYVIYTYVENRNDEKYDKTSLDLRWVEGRKFRVKNRVIIEFFIIRLLIKEINFENQCQSELF